MQPEQNRQRPGNVAAGFIAGAARLRDAPDGVHEFLVADEPVASLDPVASRRVMETLKNLNEDDGMTVIVTLHQVDYAFAYCPRTVALRAGSTAVSGGLTNPLVATLETFGASLLAIVAIAVPVVDLPLGATEDRVCGTLDIERALTAVRVDGGRRDVVQVPCAQALK